MTDLVVLADRVERGEIKALSIKQPYPHHIFYDGKDVENRGWRPPQEEFGQDIAIHAGLTYDALGAAWIEQQNGGKRGK